MLWNLVADRPIYAQLLDIIKLRIISGIYKPGAKFPSVRELAAEAGVNPNTMQKALTELERSGLIITQRTSGRTVTEDKEMIQGIKNQLATDEILSFIKKMRELGFEKKELLELMESIMKGEV